MRKGFIIGMGSVLLSGLLVTQSWAGTFKSDLYCGASIVKKGKVSIAPNGTVKGLIELNQPLPNPVQLSCAIWCGNNLSAGPAPCIDADVGATALKIKAPGLGATLSICEQPAVAVDVCVSAYVP